MIQWNWIIVNYYLKLKQKYVTKLDKRLDK